MLFHTGTFLVFFLIFYADYLALYVDPIYVALGDYHAPAWSGFRDTHTVNHPRLLPQLSPRIACYRETASDRLGILVEHNVPLLSWANHLRIAYFDNRDLPRWTIEHPGSNPVDAAAIGCSSWSAR